MNKGFAYTTFAILSATLLMSLVFMQVYQPSSISEANAERIGEASFFLQSLFTDMDRSLEIATRRSFTGATNYVVTEGEALDEPEKNVSEILVNGTLDGKDIETVGNASLKEWGDRVAGIADRSGYSLKTAVVDYSFNTTGFNVKSSFTVFARLKDPASLAAFNETRSAEATVSVIGLEDPLITLRSAGRYTKTISRCGFDRPAEKIQSGTQNSSSTVYGDIALRPSNGETVYNQGERIAAVKDPDSYSGNYLEGFAGVIGAEESTNPGNINSNYILGVGSLEDLRENMTVLMEREDVWIMRFEKMFEETGCYMKSERGPGFLNRLGNRLESPNSTGILTLIDESKIPAELRQNGDNSAVGFVYFNESSSGAREIKGISDQYSWFRLDQHHIDHWNMNELVE